MKFYFLAFSAVGECYADEQEAADWKQALHFEIQNAAEFRARRRRRRRLSSHSFRVLLPSSSQTRPHKHRSRAREGYLHPFDI
jgi:hypothetical protein